MQFPQKKKTHYVNQIKVSGLMYASRDVLGEPRIKRKRAPIGCWISCDAYAIYLGLANENYADNWDTRKRCQPSVGTNVLIN